MRVRDSRPGLGKLPADAPSFGPSPILWSNMAKEDLGHKPLVVLDRDNTIITDCGRTNRIEEFVWIAGVPNALKLIVDAGYHVAIATNQAGLERGLFPEEQLEAFHRNLDEEFFKKTRTHIAVIAICPHKPETSCECRKPRPGLLHAIAENGFGTPCVLFGDSRTDIEAARYFGIPGIKVSTGFLLSAVTEWLGNQ